MPRTLSPPTDKISGRGHWRSRCCAGVGRPGRSHSRGATMTSGASESAMEAVTADARNKDQPPHEVAPSEDGPRDRVDPEELTVASADGDQGPREDQKRSGGM